MRTTTRTGFCGALIALTPFAAAPGWAAPLGFTDQTQAAGLHFTHRPASTSPARPMDGGGAVGDFNADGYADLFVIGGGNVPDALFINNRDGTFTDRAVEWGLTDLHMGVGAAVADMDGDGDEDLYVTSMGTTAPQAQAGQHRLYRNDGGRFTEIAKKAHVNETTPWADGFGASFGDYDRDGDLDLFVGGWHLADAPGSRLFRNDGDGGFSDVSEAAGLLVSDMRAFGAIFADIDNDRWPDLLVAGDFGTSRIYINKTNGRFEEIDPGTGMPIGDGDTGWSTGKAYNAMGSTVGDFNRDGRLDWFVTAIWPAWMDESPFWGNGLYLNQGGRVFVEASAAARVNDGGWGWGTSAVDWDNDGWLDIAMTNGWTATDPVTGYEFDAEQAYLFRNTGGGEFEEIALSAGVDHTLQGRGLVHLDYDRDGDMDLVIFSHADSLRLYRNELIAAGATPPSDAHWLQVRLDTSGDCALAPGGFGAQIRVMAGRKRLYHQVTSGGTYLGGSESVAHFGLGPNFRAALVVVDWGDGSRTGLRYVSADRRITISPPGCGTAREAPQPNRPSG